MRLNPPTSQSPWQKLSALQASRSSALPFTFSTITFTAFASSIPLEEGTMTKRIQTSDPTVKRLRESGPTVRRLDPKTVADALGGQPCPEWIEGQPGPVTLYALRQELLRRRQSSGGRPGIEGTSFRAKVPVGDQDWHRLEAIAASLSAQGFTPSPGQVASVLLSIALRTVTTDLGEKPGEQAGYTTALAKELAARLGTVKQP